MRGKEIRRINTREQLAAPYCIAYRANIQALDPAGLSNLNGFNTVLIDCDQSDGIYDAGKTASFDGRESDS